MDRRTELLDRLAAVAGGDQTLRAAYAAAPIERIEAAIAIIRETRRKVERYGPLPSDWMSPTGMRIERPGES